jgi:hypothetical protein
MSIKSDYDRNIDAIKAKKLQAIELAKRAGLNRLDRFDPVIARAI